MPRVKRSKAHLKRRKNILKKAKGYRWGRKSLMKLAKVAVTKAGAYRYRDRRVKKRNIRGLWILRLNAALKLRGQNLNYSKFIAALKKEGIILDRKILSEIAQKHPAIFDRILKEISLA